jgi:hypothetical protein
MIAWPLVIAIVLLVAVGFAVLGAYLRSRLPAHDDDEPVPRLTSAPR